MRAEDIFYKANYIYFKSLTCLRCDVSGSGWPTTSAKNNLWGKTLQWVENLNHNSTIVSKHRKAIIHPQTSDSPNTIKLAGTFQSFKR